MARRRVFHGWDQGGAEINHFPDMVPGPFNFIRVICKPQGGSQYGQHSLGNDNIAFTGRMQAADDHIGQTGIDRYHYTGPRLDGKVNASQSCRFTGPGSGCIYDQIGLHVMFTMPVMV